LTAVIANLAGTGLVVAAIIGGIVGLLYFGVGFALGGMRFTQTWKTYEPHSPSPAAAPEQPPAE
jgi:hypothetical protein